MNNEQFFYYLCQKFNFTYDKFLLNCQILIVTQPFVDNNNSSILFFNFDTDQICIANKIYIDSDNIIIYEGSFSISQNQATLCYNKLEYLINQYNEATLNIKSNILKSKLESINKDF